MEGPDVADPAHSALLDYLGVSLFTAGTTSGVQDLSGVESTFSQGFEFEYQYETMADYKVDMLKEDGGTAFLKSQDGWTRGVFYDASDYRTITVSPFFGGMKDKEGENTKANLMAGYLAYLLRLDPPVLDAPVNVEVDEETGLVSWEDPVPGEWLAWDSGENDYGVGATENMTFSVASRWKKTDLAPYDGCQLARIRLFPLGANSTYTLKVWTGYYAANEIYSQELSELTIGEWNEVDISSAGVYIDSSEELWFGYTVDCAAGELAAGYDEGPVVPAQSDVIHLFGSWDYIYSVTEEGVSLSWNLQALVLDQTGRSMAMSPTAQPTEPAPLSSLSDTAELIFGETTTEKGRSIRAELTGYNVYLDSELVGENVAGNEYLLNNLISGQNYLVGVSAVYDNGGESEIVEVEFIYSGVDAGNDMVTTTTLNGNYPNPFNPETTISFELNTENTEDTELVIYNVKGQKIKTLVNEKLPAGHHSVVWNGTDNNGNSVASGIYFYKMKAGRYTSTKKMVLMK